MSTRVTTNFDVRLNVCVWKTLLLGEVPDVYANIVSGGLEGRIPR